MTVKHQSFGFLDLVFFEKVYFFVRQYYLSLPGRTESMWCIYVAKNPRAFNLVWRASLRPIYPLLPLNDKPPPIYLRQQFNPNLYGRNLSAITKNHKLAVE